MLTQAAAAASVPGHESYYAVRSQKGRCESAPDNPETGDTNQSSRGGSRAGILGGAAASEKRDAKRTNKSAQPRRLLSQQAHIVTSWGHNKLLLQQLAVAAGCCCSVLLNCGDESAPPNKWGTAYAHNGTLSSIISRVEDFNDVTQHML